MTVTPPDIRTAVAGTKNKAEDYNHNFSEINRFVTEKEAENNNNISAISSSVSNLSTKINADRTITLSGDVTGTANFNLGSSNSITINVSFDTLFDLITPDYSNAIEITQPISTERYVAPKAGVYHFFANSNASSRKLYVNDTEINAFYYQDGEGDGMQYSLTVILGKDDEIYWSGKRWTSKNTFIPFKGA